MPTVFRNSLVKLQGIQKTWRECLRICTSFYWCQKVVNRYHIKWFSRSSSSNYTVSILMGKKERFWFTFKWKYQFWNFITKQPKRLKNIESINASLSISIEKFKQSFREHIFQVEESGSFILLSFDEFFAVFLSENYNLRRCRLNLFFFVYNKFYPLFRKNTKEVLERKIFMLYPQYKFPEKIRIK